MPTPIWAPGSLQPNGSIVQPASAPPIVSTPITNPGFESGDTGWTKGTGWTIGAVGPFSGANAAQFDFTGTSDIVNLGVAAVAPGQSIMASCMVQQGASSAGQAGARCVLIWLTSGDVEISRSQGNLVDNASGGAWYPSTVTGVAPATAAKVVVAATAFRNSGSNPLWVDQFTWNHSGPAVPEGLVYRAVQTGLGTTASTEPTWPLVLGQTVVDGTVTWEAVAATRVVWEANPLFRTGMTEPNWPTDPGATIADGTLVWEAVSRRVTDTNCPNTTIVLILAMKIFCGDDDIVRYSATANPLNWSLEDNAGYLPTGMQGQNANGVRVLAEYRKNMAALNASSFQLWQADPDPELMDILDQKNGIGSIFHAAACSVGDDLFYLSAEGIRNVTQAAGNNSNTAGAVGAPIDELVREALAAALEGGRRPISHYYPGLGQYLLAFPNEQRLGEYELLADSGEVYTFDSPGDWASLEGSVIESDNPDGPHTWTLQLAPWTLVRISCLEFNGGEGPPGLATFSTANDIITNEAAEGANEFLPAQFEIVVGVDGLLSFSVESPGAEYQFQVELFIQEEPTEETTEVFVATKMGGSAWSWSRYLFPFLITDFSLYENDLYFRHGDHINVFDKAVVHDELDAEGGEVEFAGRVQWNWLDMGAAGSEKHLQAFELIATGTASVSFGYNQRQPLTAWTDPYTLEDADTLPGGPIQYEVTAPSISVRIDFAPGAAWSLSSFIAYVDDLGPNV